MSYVRVEFENINPKRLAKLIEDGHPHLKVVLVNPEENWLVIEGSISCENAQDIVWDYNAGCYANATVVDEEWVDEYF